MGKPAPTDIQVTCAIADAPVGVETLAWPQACGAEAVFLGRTRTETHPQLGRLLRLEYEAYRPMAEQLLGQITRRHVERFGCLAARVVHTLGVVEPGQASVVIQVAAPHRAEAFDACRAIIDQLKREVPIWKREVYEHGSVFVEGAAVQPNES
jgi:molybdopterin synthase catalytic subunit